MVSFEEMVEESKKHAEEEKERKRQYNRMWMEDLRKQGIEPTFDEDGKSLIPPKKETWDHPSTMENSTATVLWIVAMVISLLFKNGWVLCILETIVWWKHITRHNR